MGLYFHSASAISPQRNSFLNEIEILAENEIHQAVEPGYSEYISPAMARRMSRIIKMGVASALQCMEPFGNNQKPDAIISGTGFGCFDDSIKFLEQIIYNNESMLSPTPFIQSTHNTVGAQIALIIGCNGYNNTHVHGGLTFENCLADALMFLNSNVESLVLIGTAEELTPTYIALRRKWFQDNVDSPQVMNLGEGAAFFCVNNSRNNAVLELKSIKSIYNPNNEDLKKILKNLLDANGINEKDIGYVLSGESNSAGGKLLGNLLSLKFEAEIIIPFKKYCGEYFTATSFAMWLAFQYFKEMPETTWILIANQYRDKEFSMMILCNAKN